MLADMEALQARLEALLTISITIGQLTMACSGTVSITLRPEDCHNTRDFMHHADSRLYSAKRQRTGERRRGGDRRRSA